MLGSILSALAAIPKIVSLVESFASAVTTWYITSRTTANLSAIADATALAARATTDQERYDAAQALQKAISAARVTAT